MYAKYILRTACSLWIDEKEPFVPSFNPRDHQISVLQASFSVPIFGGWPPRHMEILRYGAYDGLRDLFGLLPKRAREREHHRTRLRRPTRSRISAILAAVLSLPSPTSLRPGIGPRPAFAFVTRGNCAGDLVENEISRLTASLHDGGASRWNPSAG